MYCGKCGKQIKEGNLFCTGCGERSDDDSSYVHESFDMHPQNESDFFDTIIREMKQKSTSFNASAYNGFLAIQVTLKDLNKVFYVEVKNGRLSIEPYEHYDRQANIIMNSTDFIKMIDGKLSSVLAFTTGTLCVEGDIAKAGELSKILANRVSDQNVISNSIDDKKISIHIKINSYNGISYTHTLYFDPSDPKLKNYLTTLTSIWLSSTSDLTTILSSIDNESIDMITEYNARIDDIIDSVFGIGTSVEVLKYKGVMILDEIISQLKVGIDWFNTSGKISTAERPNIDIIMKDDRLPLKVNVKTPNGTKTHTLLFSPADPHLYLHIYKLGGFRKDSLLTDIGYIKDFTFHFDRIFGDGVSSIVFQHNGYEGAILNKIIAAVREGVDWYKNILDNVMKDTVSKKEKLSEASGINRTTSSNVRRKSLKTIFFCTDCGNEFPKWSGQCPGCGA